MPKGKQEQTAPLPLDQPHWKERTATTHEEHVSTAKSEGKNKASTLIIGSSMVERFQSTPFFPMFETDCILAGVGGDRVQEMLWRVENGILEACPETVQTIVLMAGTNNIEKADPKDLAANGLAPLVKAILTHRTTIKRFLLFGLPPRSSPIKKLDDVTMNKKVDEYNLQTEQLVQKLQGEYPEITWEYKYFGTELRVSEDGIKDDKFFEDHVHLNNLGYSVFAKHVGSALGLQVPEWSAEEEKEDTTGEST
eukprot:TRINITY_DN75108_c0_g1_i1.p1 TRINITY_DN75108_c0_g1~~TRINITY_DN75108_c0_g1_i1.p1  ORF type:complete len:252 (-),score=19.57 TRINITY_DN75108_c0_g1_i1:86-841(-)